MVLKLSKDEKKTSSVMKNLSRFLRWIRPGSHTQSEFKRGFTASKRSEQAKLSSQKEKPKSGARYITIVPKSTLRTPTDKQKRQYTGNWDQDVPLIEPLKGNPSGKKGNANDTVHWKLRGAPALEGMTNDYIHIIEPSEKVKSTSNHSGSPPAEWRLKRAVPLEHAHGGSVLTVPKARKHRHSESTTARSDNITIVPFRSRKSSRSRSRRRSARRDTPDRSRRNSSIKATIVDAQQNDEYHDKNDETKPTYTDSERKHRGRSASRDHTKKHKNQHHRSGTPSSLPELDGKGIDSPASQHDDIDTPRAERKIQATNIQEIATLLGIKDCGNSNLLHKTPHVYNEPMIFDESKHDPEDFYNSSFLPSDHSPHIPCLSKTSQFSGTGSIHLAPPTFDLSAGSQFKVKPADNKPVSRSNTRHQSSYTVSGSSADEKIAVRSSVYELSAESLSARPCISYERLRPVAPHRRVQSEITTIPSQQKNLEPNPVKRHTRSASTYSYTPTRETRADRKSFNTIRFVDSSMTSHEKLRKVLGI